MAKPAGAVGVIMLPGLEGRRGRAVITPQKPVWMAGYANRDHAAYEGKITGPVGKSPRLFLRMQTEAVCADHLICAAYQRICPDYIRPGRPEIKYKLDKAQVIINSSHTHSGPVVLTPFRMLTTTDEEQKQKKCHIPIMYQKQIIQLAGDAMKSPGTCRIYREWIYAFSY